MTIEMATPKEAIVVPPEGLSWEDLSFLLLTPGIFGIERLAEGKRQLYESESLSVNLRVTSQGNGEINIKNLDDEVEGVEDNTVTIRIPQDAPYFVIRKVMDPETILISSLIYYRDDEIDNPLPGKDYHIKGPRELVPA